MNSQHEADLRAELTRLQNFCDEVRAPATTRPRQYVVGWGAAAATVIMIERQIVALSGEIERLAERSGQ